MQLRSIMILLCVLPGLATAGPAMMRSVQGAYDDVTFDLENAIVNQGLVVDWVSHIGVMLARTGEVIEGAEPIYTNAAVYNFCSAELSRAAMQLSPENIQNCPYGIFVYETAAEPGTIIIGHRVYEDDGMQDVNALLDVIVNDVMGD